MKALLIGICLLTLATPLMAQESSPYWNDKQPEPVLGIYFDEAGTDSIWDEAIPDTLTIYLRLSNGGLRNEGFIRALEYRLELPDGLILLKDTLPEYSNLAMGHVTKGFTQAVRNQPGHDLLINTLTLMKTGEIAYDARIRLLPHPDSGYLRYAHGWGGDHKTGMHMLVAGDALLNPKVSRDRFKPVRSRD